MGSKSPRTLIRQSLLSTRGHRWRHRNKNQTSKHAQKVVNDTALKESKTRSLENGEPGMKDKGGFGEGP